MLIRMKAIEYNAWMTIIDMLKTNMATYISEYGYVIDKQIKISPSYPRDLTKLYKPSIIVRRVDIDQSKLSLDGFIGQYFDKPSNTHMDVHGILHRLEYQFDVCTDSNVQMVVVESLLHDIFNNLIVGESKGRFQLHDYTVDVNNPTDMGIIKVSKDLSSTPLMSDNGNNDYISATRIVFDVVQTIVPNQEYVDLSKWIKQSFTIKTI